MKIAVLDDWQGVAEHYGDWNALRRRGEVTFFQDAMPDEGQAASTLADYDILLTVQSRTALPGSLLRRLPKVKMIGITISNALLDLEACAQQGITVCRTDSPGKDAGWATAELALGLMIASFRGLPDATANMRKGLFQQGVPTGRALSGRTLGIIGFGRLGARVASYGVALGMRVIAWSAHLNEDKLDGLGVERVSKEQVFAEADVVSLHVTLNEETRGLVGAPELAQMRPGSLLVNTSRGPIVDEGALLQALREKKINAALDVFDMEPLPADHPLRHLENVVLTSHLGYCVDEAWNTFYPQTIENVLAFLDGRPIRILSK